ncbi:glycine zipper domain-containing protein [Bosea sp. (in: a-proteobacteria)]|uniref:glycine zipper domain-containing protein n=1 Tax=Bosea sp. (in: a-proteobacteria) TaxID=1871050 RepID=UPI002DDD1659|nr:glycine zipper domain-containing protein [Bosea sp. (in: a-proteobacteria)]HEV2509139.1 glycine zipper domain-containing protein [Bosea sp. (in: a-proteobacteria)]
MTMKKLLLVAAAVTALGACTPREERTATGALIGAGAGALIGGAATGRAGGALAGAAIGGAGGAIIGNATSPNQVCYDRDEWGRRIRYAC